MPKFEGIGDFVRETLAQATPEPTRDPALEMLSAAGIVTKGIKTGSPEYITLMSETDWAAVQKALDGAKAAQEARSTQYGITVKEGGSISKPSELSDVPDDEFGDPVNHRFSLADEDQATVAASQWSEHQKEYSAEEQKVIGSRIRRAQKKFANAVKAFRENQDLRVERSGIQTKSFYAEDQVPEDDSAVEPTAYADFTNYSLRIDSPETLAQTQTEWAAIKRFSPDLYDEDEAKLIETAIEHAAKRFETKGENNQRPSTPGAKVLEVEGQPAGRGDEGTPSMKDCPNCKNTMPSKDTTCPHCGNSPSPDPEDASDGGVDEMTEDRQKAFETEARAAAEALIAAHQSGDKDAVLEATKAATLVSHQVAGRQKALELTEIQGIVEHGLQMGGVCPNCAITGSPSVTKGAATNTTDMTSSLQRERDEAVAELARVKAAGSDVSALEKAKEDVADIEQEADELRLELKTEKANKATLQTEFEAQAKRLAEFERRYPRRDKVSRKSVSVVGTGVAQAHPEPPQTFHEAQARKREADGR